MTKVLYHILFAPLYALSLLPLGVLYVLSDLLFPVVYYVVRYRRKLVRRQMTECLPEWDDQAIIREEKRFYHFFCDYIVETLKLFSMSEAEMRRRVQFVGLDDDLVSAMQREGKQFAFGYLGHYGNWEWISSFPMWIPKDVHGGQIYHPLRNKAFDTLFLKIRSRFGAECIPMKETLRQIINTRRRGESEIIGFIADQLPKWEAMHHWTRFLHHDTFFFIGTERIGKQVDALIYFLDVTRPRRGYYVVTLKPIATDAKAHPDYEITDTYARMLEENIRREPYLWLWTHNRWKRTREEWEQRQQQKKH